MVFVAFANTMIGLFVDYKIDLNFKSIESQLMGKIATNRT